MNDSFNLFNIPKEEFPSWTEFQNIVRKIYFSALINISGDNITKAASISKIGRPYLYRHLKKTKVRENKKVIKCTEIVAKSNNPRIEYSDEELRRRRFVFKELVEKGIIKKGQYFDDGSFKIRKEN